MRNSRKGQGRVKRAGIQRFAIQKMRAILEEIVTTAGIALQNSNDSKIDQHGIGGGT
jgi:hypothetical protein